MQLRDQHPPSLKQRALRVTEAAAYLGASKSALDHARLTGELFGHPAPPFIRLNRGVRYLIDDLDKWLENLPRHEHTAAEAAGGPK